MNEMKPLVSAAACLAALSACSANDAEPTQPTPTATVKEAAPDGDGGEVETLPIEAYDEPLPQTREQEIAAQIGLESAGIDGFWTYRAGELTCEVNYVVTNRRDVKLWQESGADIVTNPGGTIAVVADGDECAAPLQAALANVA